MVRVSFVASTAVLLSLSLTPTACSQGATPGPGPGVGQQADTTPTDELRELDLTGRDTFEQVPDLNGGALGPDAPLENPFEFDGPMTPDRIGELVKLVDPEAQDMGNGYIFKIQDRDLRLVYDERADRMRIITPIIPASGLPSELLNRMLQANFDAVLDARYAVGGGNVWSVFIHRLSSLNTEDLISGISQTAVAADTFGSTFTSGAVVFGGGDSSELHRDLEERLRRAIEESGGQDDRGI